MSRCSRYSFPFTAPLIPTRNEKMLSTFSSQATNKVVEYKDLCFHQFCGGFTDQCKLSQLPVWRNISKFCESRNIRFVNCTCTVSMSDGILYLCIIQVATQSLRAQHFWRYSTSAFLTNSFVFVSPQPDPPRFAWDDTLQI